MTMHEQVLQRRALLKLGSSAAVAALMSAATPTLLANSVQRRESGKFHTLTEPLARTLEAVTARILPTTDTPGAQEAGAVWFIDSMAGGLLQPILGDLEKGADELNRAAGGSFTQLAETEQDAVLVSIEHSEFFSMMHMLTLAGTFSMSRYGGNSGELGWDLLGFERRHHWQAPFGYYDAKVHGAPETVQ